LRANPVPLALSSLNFGKSLPSLAPDLVVQIRVRRLVKILFLITDRNLALKFVRIFSRIHEMAPIVRAVADSGVQIVYAEPLSRHPPGLNRHRGIGIKKAGSETWEDLNDVKLFQLEWTIQAPGLDSGSVFLPRLGMLPRELEEEMMKLARAGASFDNTGCFIYASVMKAIDALPREWITINPSLPGYPRGDDVVISLPEVASGLQDSMKEVNPQTGMEIQKKFEFRTALPEAGSHPDEIVDLEHLYFIQVLPNELPSYHFWATENDTPTARKGYHDRRIYTWFSRNANTSNPDSNIKQGLHETTLPRDANGSSSTNGPPALTTSRPSAGRQRSARNTSSTKPGVDTKISKNKNRPGKTKNRPSKNNIDRSYRPPKAEEEELQEVKLNKRKKKVAEDAQLYKPKLDDDEEDSQQAKINRRRLKISGDAKSYKPDRIGTRMTRK
jgi:hypothetical protein